MPETLLRTALHEAHQGLGARLVPFSGWEMPVRYEGILAEHRAVRSATGLFDVSHMGRLEVTGESAMAVLDSLLAMDVANLAVDRARYGMFCLEDGGILDDVVVYKQSPEHLLVVCNAGNREAVAAWIERGAMRHAGVCITDRTLETVMLALQGPGATQALSDLLGVPTRLTRFGGQLVEWQGDELLITRTGYTGEDGFEFIGSAETGRRLWRQLMTMGVTPCGLGARDTLRLEAGLLLHGNDMDYDTNPVEVGLLRFVHMQDREFVGKSAILRVLDESVTRTLVGFQTDERGAVPRRGHAILHAGQHAGEVTSGSFSPTLERNIGLGFIPPDLSVIGQQLDIDVRGVSVSVTVRSLPFYRRLAT